MGARLWRLAPNEVPGLSIRAQSGNWIAPPAVPDAFIVNGGQLLRRWTNDRFLATPHRAVNRNSRSAFLVKAFVICARNVFYSLADSVHYAC